MQSIERWLYREGHHTVYREMALYLQRGASYSLQRDGFISTVQRGASYSLQIDGFISKERGFIQSIERWLYIYREGLHAVYREMALYLQRKASYYLQWWLYIYCMYKKGLHAVYRSGFTSLGRGFILSIEIWPFIYRKGLLTGFREMALYLQRVASYSPQRWLYIYRDSEASYCLHVRRWLNIYGEGLPTVYRDGFILRGRGFIQSIEMALYLQERGFKLSICIYGFILRGRCFILYL